MIKKQARRRVKYFLLYWFVRFLLTFSNFLPRTWWLAFCGWLGKIGFALMGRYRDMTVAHLGLAFRQEKTAEEIHALAQQSFTMMGKNAGDLFRALKVKTLADIEKFVTITGFEHFENANKKGKGVVFLACHMGAFDLKVTYISLRGYKTHVIGTTLKDPRLNELLVNHRNAYGAVAVERGKETFALIKALKLGGAVAILIDQDTKVKSVFVDFFGMKASTPIGAAMLAMKTGAAVVPATIHLGKDNKQHIEVFPELEVTLTGNEEANIETNTQRFTTFIEQQIRKHPEQWLWVHERWKTRPTPVA